MPRSLPSSFVLCGATAPNGSFVNHQQLFGSVCKTAGLRIRPPVLAFFGPFSLYWPFPGLKPTLQKIPQCLSREKRVLGGNPKCLFNVVALWGGQHLSQAISFIVLPLWPVLCIFNQQPDHFLWKGWIFHAENCKLSPPPTFLYLMTTVYGLFIN